MVMNKNAWYEASSEADDIPLVAAVPMAPPYGEQGDEETNIIPVIIVSTDRVPPVAEAERVAKPKNLEQRQEDADKTEEDDNEKGEKPRISCRHTNGNRKCRGCRKEWKEMKCHLKREFKSMKQEAKKEWKEMKRISKTEAKAMKKDLKQEHRELKHSLRQSWRHLEGSSEDVKEAFKRDMKEEKRAVKADARMLKREARESVREMKREFRGMNRAIREAVRGH